MIKPPLLIGFALLLALLLGSGIYAIRVTQSLAYSVERHQEEAFVVVNSLERIKHAANRLNNAVAMKLADQEDEGMVIFQQSAETLSEHLSILTNRRLRTAQEEELLGELREQVNVLLSESERILYRDDDAGAVRVRLSQVLIPRVMDVSETADRVLNFENRAMSQTREDLRSQGQRAAALWIGTLVFAVGFVIISARYLETRLFRPVRDLTHGINQVGEGELDEAVPVRSDDEVGRLAHAFNQMTTQLRATRAGTTERLMRLHRTMQATLASFPHPFFVLGRDRSIELRNPAADKLAVKLFLGGKAELPPAINEHIDRVLETGTNYLPNNLSEALTLHIDHEKKFFLPRVLLLLDERGDPFGVAVFLENVTKQRLLDEVKTNLLSTVSHELKTPLTSVRMALHLLLERTIGPLNDKQYDLLRTAKDDSERLLRTLNNLLDLTKLEEARPPLELSDLHIPDLLHGVISDLQETVEANDLQIVEEIDQELPQVRVDREKIDHVFSNFVTNAIKHSPPGGKIIIRARMLLEDQVRVSVVDEGPGISAEHRERLFDKFYRVPGQSKTGAGLGLSIAREIAHMHKGSVGVISKPGEGAEFYVDLPTLDHDEAFPSTGRPAMDYTRS